MTYRRFEYQGFAIHHDGNVYNIVDEMGFWVGAQGTLAFAKERIREILAQRG